MHEGSTSIDQLNLERFFGPAQLVRMEDEQLPKNMGLLFNEFVSIDCLEKIMQVNPSFVGGDLSEDLERALLAREIVTYTGLIHLDELPKYETFMFYGFPLKIMDGDGSPVRAVAILSE